MKSKDSTHTQGTFDALEQTDEMSKNVLTTLCIVVMVVVIFGVDFWFFRNRFWERLLANIGIVLIFAAFYLRFLKNP